MDITVRHVEERDLDSLVELDYEVWKALHTPLMSREDLASWLAEDSPFFLLAEDGDGPLAYAFSRRMDFTFDRASIDAFLDPSLITGKGMTAWPHSARGNTGYGICVASLQPGAAGAIVKHQHKLVEEFGLPYFIGYSRLAGLDAYAKEVEASHGGALPCSLEDLALWYAHESARLLEMQEWDEVRRKPDLDLAPLSVPDPVLRFHVRYTRYGVLDIQPGYMEDPASRGYAVFMASKYPHRP